MTRLRSFAIAMTLTLVCDNALNHGALTVELAESAGNARDWAVHSGDGVADTFISFRS